MDEIKLKIETAENEEFVRFFFKTTTIKASILFYFRKQNKWIK